MYKPDFLKLYFAVPFFGFLFLLSLAPIYGENFTQALHIPPLLDYRTDEKGRKIFNLTADEGSVQFVDGVSTNTLGFNGDYLGPTIRVRRNDQVSIEVLNQLKDPTTVHWHGADVPALSDGNPLQPIKPRGTWTANFTVRQQAATLWYHPHFIETTGRQVYEGLAGLLIIDDGISDSLDIPNQYGVDDIPIIMQERRFDRRGRFVYRPGMHDLMHGYSGNRLLTNGVIEPYMEVAEGLNRLRLLNGSNSSVLRVYLDNSQDMMQVASDGGFLEKALPQEFIILSPGERAEVLVDFKFQKSNPIRLIAETVDRNRYTALEFRKGPHSTPKRELSDFLVAKETIKESEAVRERQFILQSAMGGRMMVNGRRMDLRQISERVRLGDTEIWRIVNADGRGNGRGMMGGMMGGMMSQPHSFHIHAVQFQILDINGSPPPANLAGWKDTILLWPGDEFRVIARFHSYPGVFMYHCHFLEHEDNGMMGQFEIEDL